MAERLLYTEDVGGSSPSLRTPRARSRPAHQTKTRDPESPAWTLPKTSLLRDGKKTGWSLARMASEIIVAPQAAKDFRRLDRTMQTTAKKAIELQ